ncbi:hypothetical protein Poli38472_007357 [Pythium oligandrum]|uniref:Folate-Biopterin Transporter (FBT) Family n=1 Tax=Pythium oligandrum TaxID=41045 RepID=A0A8K1C9T4_PYTOL|nr:hypothetical protein Poli38472_007357 [Pythium oligandrum]|eukprot:TMW59212.1 hypothetical protein Poli38472_007357 [Pythium oligandrum]
MPIRSSSGQRSILSPGSSLEDERPSFSPINENGPSRNGHDFRTVKTPLVGVPEEIEGGALREGGAPTLLSRESFGLLAQYAVVGLIYGALPGTIYPFMVNYLNVQGNEAVAARTLVSIPWSFKVFYGFLTDCFPIFGYRRRPYMILGWSICLGMLVIMACTPIGKPYYGDPSLRKIKPELYTAENRATLNLSAQGEGGKYVVLMMCASVGYLMSDVAADAVVVEFAQREPEAIRGRTQTAIYTVRTVFMVLANILSAFTFNGYDYGGDYSFTLSFPQFMLCLAIVTAPILPITWFTIREERYESPGFYNYLSEFWSVLQTRAVIQVIAYKFFAGLFQNFTFVAMDPMQTYWADVSPRNEKIANIFLLGVMALTLVFTGRYGLHWNWRLITALTMIAMVVMDAVCMFFFTWNVWRNQYFWLGIPVLEQLPYGVQFIVSTYVVVELAAMGHEGAIYGLLTTVSNLSDPFARTLTKNVNAAFDITNEAIQNDTTEVRKNISATLMIMYGMRLLSLIWLPLLPPQKKATQLLRAHGGTSRTLGLATVMYIAFAMVWSVATNLMSMFPTTSCLIIAGGSGCGQKNNNT